MVPLIVYLLFNFCDVTHQEVTQPGSPKAVGETGNALAVQTAQWGFYTEKVVKTALH